MSETKTLTVTAACELALVQLGGKSRSQAEVFAKEMTPAEQLAAASCQREGDKLRLIDLLDHVATRQHLEADLQAFNAPAFQQVSDAADPEDPTDRE